MYIHTAIFIQMKENQISGCIRGIVSFNHARPRNGLDSIKFGADRDFKSIRRFLSLTVFFVHDLPEDPLRTSAGADGADAEGLRRGGRKRRWWRRGTGRAGLSAGRGTGGGSGGRHGGSGSEAHGGQTIGM